MVSTKYITPHMLVLNSLEMGMSDEDELDRVVKFGVGKAKESGVEVFGNPEDIHETLKDLSYHGLAEKVRPGEYALTIRGRVIMHKDRNMRIRNASSGLQYLAQRAEATI